MLSLHQISGFLTDILAGRVGQIQGNQKFIHRRFASSSLFKNDLPTCRNLSSSRQSGFEQFCNKLSDAGRLGFARASDVERANVVPFQEF
jgi:hypothetical protein